MKKITTLDARLLSFTAVAAIIGAGLAGAVGGSAFYDTSTIGFRGQVSAETREAFNRALEDGDYESWVEIATTQCKQELTEERFTAMSQRYNEQVERHEALENILDENDFEAWSDFISESEDWGRGKIREVVTEENFPTFVAMHEAMEAGDVALAKELREKLGLEIRVRTGQGLQNRGHHRGMRGLK